ncbi:hypothetical protein [Mycobacteroides abscessus]|uniref:hypothetical protein n=1 Tax=Mycobacteroides abscessus TaxID=36809 RepID=UPI002108368B|nr:hypothetical protein [Mycobacteroides abscessus]
MPLAVAALQLLIISRGDPATLRVLIQAADPLKVVLGSTLPLLPMVLYYLAPYYLERRIRGESVPTWWSWAAIVITALAAFALPSALFGALAFIYASMVFVFIEWIIRRRGGKSVRVYYPILWMVAVIVLLAGLVGPWLPPEVVKIKGEGPIIAYVVSSNDGWTTLLRYGGGIKLTRSADVLSRTVCNSRIRGRSALGQLLSWPEGNPLCSDAVKRLA